MMLFEACLGGLLRQLPHRPRGRELERLVKSGNVFVYDECSSEIKRWTDGITWSPSRVLGGYLVYRKLQQPPSRVKKSAMKSRQATAATKHDRYGPRFSSKTVENSTKKVPFRTVNDSHRNVAQLSEPIWLCEDGLVKKGITATCRGATLHLISYYTLNDVKAGRLITPSDHPNLFQITPRLELCISNSFLAPVEKTQYTNSNGCRGEHYPLAQQRAILPQVPLMPVSSTSGVMAIKGDAPEQYKCQQYFTQYQGLVTGLLSNVIDPASTCDLHRKSPRHESTAGYHSAELDLWYYMTPSV